MKKLILFLCICASIILCSCKSNKTEKELVLTPEEYCIISIYNNSKYDALFSINNKSVIFITAYEYSEIDLYERWLTLNEAGFEMGDLEKDILGKSVKIETTVFNEDAPALKDYPKISSRYFVFQKERKYTLTINKDCSVDITYNIK